MRDRLCRKTNEEIYYSKWQSKLATVEHIMQKNDNEKIKSFALSILHRK